MYCVGWQNKSNCRPVMEAAVGGCPGTPSWFLFLAIGAAAWALSGKSKAKATARGKV